MSENALRLANSMAAWKAAVRLVTTSNHALSGLASIDGVTPAAGDRVLVAGQTDPKRNGIYIANGGVWELADDFNTDNFVRKGTAVLVLDGATNALSIWVMSSPKTGSVQLGATSFAWTKIFPV